MQTWNNQHDNLIGFVDILGNFNISLRKIHVDPYKEDQLGFFKKMSYNEKLKEYNESI